MTDDEITLSVEEIDVIRAPGFETSGFEIDDLSDGINIIHGPNASGKTTTANSIERLLWPTSGGEGERLVGHINIEGEHWRVDVADGAADYQREGQDVSAPNLPPAAQRNRYILSLHELLQADTTDESFARTIERESVGGYDLDAAYETLGYSDSPITRKKGEYQAAKDAIETWREAKDEAKNLEEDQSRLTKLQRDLEEAEAAREKRDAFDQAINYRKKKSDLEDAKAELDEFPDILEEVSGDEFEEVEDLDDSIEDWQDDKEEAEEEKVAAESELEEIELPEAGISEGTIASLKEQRDSLSESESRKQQIEEELASARTKRENAKKDVQLDVEHEELAEVEQETWSAVSDLARLSQRLYSEQNFQQTVQRWIQADEDQPEAGKTNLERGSKALEQWLISGPSETDASGKGSLYIGTISAIVVSLAGIALGALVNPFLYGVVIIGIGLGIYGYWLSKREINGKDERGAHRRTFEATDLEPPSSWEEETVRERLIEIYDDIASYEIAEERVQQGNALLDEERLDQLEEQYEAKREELEESLGDVPDKTDFEFVVLVRRILDWQEAHDTVVGLEEELETVEKNIERKKESLTSELDRFEIEEIQDAADATAAIRDLEQRKSTYESAKRRLEDAESTIEKANREISKLESKKRDIFEALDLDIDDKDELESLCNQVDDFTEAKRAFNQAEAVLLDAKNDLESLPGYDPDLKEQEIRSLREERSDFEEIADQYDEIRDQISTIQERIRAAKKDTSVEDAIEEKNRALGQLEERLQVDYSNLMGDLLVSTLQERTVEANRPEVFQRANELLTVFTHGRYSLDLEEGQQTFRAYDTAKERGFALDELSSGTRIQVLLAVRLAFVDLQEEGRKLPVIFDETLANSDDLRSEVLIESIIELGKSGRQVFYFTAQGDEVAKWQYALEEDSDVPWSTVDLAAAQDMAQSVQIPDLESIESIRPDPPDPSGHDHESYGEAIPFDGINPYAGPGTAHIWYLVEDVGTLYDLLQLGVKRWGQLRNLIERERYELIPAEEEVIGEIQRNAEALEEFVESWKIGRGEPVDRSVLEASGAVSDTFIDRVSSLCEELDGDGEELVNALYSGKVDRFRDGKTEELEEYLEGQGYIVSQDPLDAEEIRIRMVEAFVEAGVPREEAHDRASEMLERLAATKDYVEA